MTQRDGFAIGVDLGTSNTVAVLRWPDGRTRPLLFDGAPVMPSAVYLDESGRLQVGRDALRLAAQDPARLELNPKRRVDEASVLLGGHEVPTVDLLGAILAAVARSAVEAVGFLPPAALTYPASWGAQRREVLATAATRAGWPPVRFVPEPVAAARYFADVLRRPVPVGGTLAVFDFGGGTLDVAVVRNSGTGFEVLGDGGIEDLGGLDIDAELVTHLGRLLEKTSVLNWAKLDRPGSMADARNRRLFWEDVRGAKEMLSRTPVAPVAVPGMDDAVHLTREELERAATPLVQRAVRETAAVIQRCGLRPDQLVGLFLVGGSSRLPLVARMLHGQLGIAPTALEQPELPVAEGALAELVPPVGSAALTPAGPVSAPPAGPVSGPPVSPAVPGLLPAGPHPTSPHPTSPQPSGLSATGPLPAPGHPAPVGAFPSPPAPVPGPRPGGSSGLLDSTPSATAGATTSPWYRRPRPLLAGAVALLLVVVGSVAATLWLRRGGYHEVRFADSLATVGAPIAMAGDGGQPGNPSATLTAIHGGRAYLGWADSAALHLIVHPLGSGSDRKVDLAVEAKASPRWLALVARADALLVYSYEYNQDLPYRLYALDPSSGKTLWDKRYGSNDAIMSVGPVLVWTDPGHDRVVGLDPKSGHENWSTENPKTDTGYLSTQIRAAYRPGDLDLASTLDEDTPLVLGGTHLIQVASDKSARVIDVTNGDTVEGKGIAEYTDLVVGSGDNIYVVTNDAGYQVSAYSLKDPASAGQTKRLFSAQGAARPVEIAPCGSGICLLERTNADFDTGTVRMIDSSGQRWSQLVAGAENLTPVGGGVLVHGSKGDRYVKFFNGKGDEVPLGSAGIGATGVRVNGGTALLFKGSLGAFPYDIALTGVAGLSGKVKPLGPLDGIRAASCSWNSEVIVCPQESQFQVWKFAA